LLVGNPADQVIDDQLLAHAGLIHERPQPCASYALRLENLIEIFICLVLEKFAFVGTPAEQGIGDQLLARAGLVHEPPQRMVEIGNASGGLSINRLIWDVT
jgi:hypothetical protein